MPFSRLPALLSALLTPIAGALECRSAPRLLRLLAGALFARGRRTVTSWFRAAGVTDDFRRAYCALWAAGRRAEGLAFRLLRGPLAPLLALVDRGGSPWDTEERRPSHADKRKALQREILREEIRAALGEGAEAQEFHALAIRLLNWAA